jgi:hypothetical protein
VADVALVARVPHFKKPWLKVSMKCLYLLPIVDSSEWHDVTSFNIFCYGRHSMTV